MALTLNPGAAYDNNYTVHYGVSVTINAHSSTWGTATLVVAIETNDGSGWVERGAYSYYCSYTSSWPPPYPARTCSSWTHEQPTITVAGLTLNSNLRLKAKSFSVSNNAGGSFSITGGSGGAYHGVTYTSDIQPVSFAQSDDFASGSQIAAVGGTSGVSLNPGVAVDNIYTVHYFATVTLNGHPTDYGTATLTVAIETNDGTGTGWLERATYLHAASYPSGPPPYSPRTDTWPHEQRAITVVGLGIGDSIRLKAKSFTTNNGAGGSFAIRGGDAEGISPETYNGVTYLGKVLRGVGVRPELTELQGFASTAMSQRFFVKNRAEVPADLSLAYSCTGVTGCSITPAAGWSAVPPGESRIATLNFTLGAAGSVGTGMVKVFDGFDSNSLRDSAAVALKAIDPLRPVLSAVAENPGGTVERDRCLTMAAGSAAAFECGDLRLIHPLPAIRTLSKARVPTLVYNSAFAEPYPIIAADVTLSATASRADSIQAVLRINGTERARGRWAGTDWTPSTVVTRRIALGYLAAADTSKVYDYTLEVAALSDTVTPTVVSGKLVIVNRRTSAFGAGWWLAGLERIEVLPDGNRLWIGGDGSARLYTSVGTGIWVGSKLDRPDTLKQIGTAYLRQLPGGLKVWFNSAGQHDSTVNRLGHRTSFSYASGRLTTITLPSLGVAQTYTFAYDGNNQLASVTTVPLNRVTIVRITAQRVDTIRDPDNMKVSFGYENPSSRRIASRTDRRGVATSYSYDAAKKLSRTYIPILGDSIGWRARDVQGLATAVPKTATDTAAVYTSFFGARHFTTGPNFIAQETRFWLDRFGAPRRTISPLNDTTLARREDGEWEGLATEVRAPNGFATRARYDGHGNVVATIAINPLSSGQDAVTRYHWDLIWDFADSVITPAGVVSAMAYFGANGNRLWQQIGTSSARRVNFRYGNSFGLVSSTVLPQTPADSMVYDGRGNLLRMRTPRGFWTSFYKDSLGRDTLIVTPIDSLDKAFGTASDSTIRLRQRTVYTIMDRDSITESIAPNRAQVIRVNKVYDSTGNLISLARTITPDPTPIGTITTQWRYDAVNRRRAEVAPDGRVDSIAYDPAGNAVLQVTRRKHPISGVRLSISSKYDAMNRVIERVSPEVQYPRDSVGIALYPTRTQLNRGYPYYPINAGYTVVSDTVRVAYNRIGADSLADNRDALVRRWYYPNGMLQAESLKVRTLEELGAGGSFEQHRYGVTYRYDLDGRRTVLKYPVQLAPQYKDSVRFAYDSINGGLGQVWDILGNQFVYHYNLRGEMDTLRYVLAGVFEARTYDNDGALVRHVVSGNRRDAVLKYDARQKVIWSANTFGAKDTLTAAYSGLGYLLNSRVSGWGETTTGGTGRAEALDTMSYDALGNVLSTRSIRSQAVGNGLSGSSSTNRVNVYGLETGRLDSVFDNGKLNHDILVYDSAGSVRAMFQSAAGPVGLENRLTYYGADGSVRAADYRRFDGNPLNEGPNRFVFEEYRYDAYGRRVWVRARRECDGITVPNDDRPRGECRTDLVRRTVWDGFQELVEIQQPGGDADPVENDTTPLRRGYPDGIDQNPFIGRVLYTYGAVLDQPLSLVRVAYADSFASTATPQPWFMWQPFSILPLWNYLGEVDRSLVGVGAPLCQVVNSVQRCVLGAWPFGWNALQVSGFAPYFWHGTVTENKRDKAQTLYRRYRLYDPLTGRFTQEDPIGLAGGLNLYGFAAGDPVNFSDPFGLCPPCAAAYVAFEIAATLYDIGDLGITAYKATQGKAGWGAVGVTAVGVGIGMVSFGGGYGGLARKGLQKVDGLLREGGELIGRAGRGAGVREVTGGVDDARALFNKLAEGGKVGPHPGVEGGLLAELPGGGHVGFRPSSKSGPPTVDVNIQGLDVRKIKFVEQQ